MPRDSKIADPKIPVPKTAVPKSADKRSRKVDVFALVLLALGLFLIVSLVSYTKADLAEPPPIYKHADGLVPLRSFAEESATAPMKLKNACGRSGAYAAEG